LNLVIDRGVAKMMNWSSSVGAAATEFTGARRLEMSNALGRLQKQPTVTRIAIFLGLFAFSASLDLVVDHDLSLFAMYLIPTLYSAWYLGAKWAYASCLAGGVVWFIRDWPGWHSYQHALIPYGNLAGRVVVLAMIVAIVSALKNALEDQYEAERRIVVRELEIASEVQRRLLPSQPPDIAGLDVAFVYRPARQLGGDYYDFFPLSSERIAIAMGDVSGKGLPSALLMASMQSLVRTNLAVHEGELARFAGELSQRLYNETTDERYATLFFAVLDTSKLSLHYVNGGHNPPLLFRKWTLSAQGSSPDVLDRGGPPLGLLAESRYFCGRASLQQGDVLVLYTDGLLDAVNKEQEQFGEERVRDVVRSSLLLSASEICEKIVDQLNEFAAGSPQWDDITLATVKVNPQREGARAKVPAMIELSTF
jgi:serine phosphatase RsbU (regulator of sigma subunit)